MSQTPTTNPPPSPSTQAVLRAVNLDAEASVLGGIFLRNEVLALLVDLEVEDFYSPKHQAVFQAMRNLEATSSPIDPVLVDAELDRVGRSEAVGGLGFLSELTLRVPSAENVEHYAEIIRGHRLTRDVVRATVDVVAVLADPGDDVTGQDAIDMLVQRVQRIEVGTSDRGKPMGEHIDVTYARILTDLEAKAAGRPIHPGMPTGLGPIDRAMGGVPYSVLTVIGGRPSAGKSTVGMALANAAMTLGDDDPLYFSYEDSGTSFALRRLAQSSGIATNRLITRDIGGDELRLLSEAHARLRASPDTLVMAAGMPIEDALRYARSYRRRRTGKLGLSRTRGRLTIFDYFQKMPMNPEFKGRRNEAIGHITRMLSWYAQEESHEAGNEVAVVGMSQLGRAVDQRDDPTPQLGDFKDSGDIEQDAKVAIGLVYWHAYDAKRPRELLEAHILKNYNGESGAVVSLHWDRETHTISDTAMDLGHARGRAGGFLREADDYYRDAPLPEEPRR